MGLKLFTLPSDLKAHKMISKIYGGRVKAIETGKDIDYGTAEALAFGTLMDEGYSVRLSGEDCERGTFSHRHSVVND